MTKEEIDILWHKAMRLSIKDGDQFTRYRFAELVAESEREAKEELLDALQDLLMDTQHSEHECEDKDCPVANAKNVALKYAAIRARGEK